MLVLMVIIISLPLVCSFHKGKVTPEVTDVSKFMETLLNDCSTAVLDDDSDDPADREEMTFLALRVSIVL